MISAATALEAPRATDLAEILKAMAHPLRLRVLTTLAGGRQNVGDLADLLGVQQSIMSQQLRILRMSGIVTVLREGGHAFYALVDNRMIELLSCLERCGEARSRHYDTGTPALLDA